MMSPQAVVMSPLAVGMSLFAHEGGWDEIALVAGPILILAGLLVLANRRADKAAAERDVSEGSSPTPGAR